MKNYYIILYKDGLQMSNYSEDDVRSAAEIREWLIKQISDKQDEVERLRIILSLIDSLLKQSSFKAASSLGSSYGKASIAQTSHTTKISTPLKEENLTIASNDIPEAFSSENGQTDLAEAIETRPLKRLKDNLLLANAEISPSTVEISPVEGINLNVNTPPFKSFFLNRILEGMKTKDMEKINHSQIKESESLNYQVEEDINGLIKRIVINNYRENERLAEIFNTSTWVFTRMIEKIGR
jgi:aspartate-semialdehyde dehydrogenase